jgi:cytochrome c oxidase cbb3-type subunit III
MPLAVWLLLTGVVCLAQDISLGRRLFESQCSVCHGLTGTGGRGPALNRAELSKARNDESLRKVIGEGIEPEMPGAWQLSPREVASVASFVRSLGSVPAEPLPGDAVRGAAVYRAQGCAACHIVRGEGSGFGPELTSIGVRRSAAHLREALTTPGAFVAEEWLAVEAATSAGAVRGVRANEDSFTIQIRTPDGRFHSMRKSELRSLRKLHGKSAMPGYASLPPEQLDDLTAYLASLRGQQ